MITDNNGHSERRRGLSLKSYVSQLRQDTCYASAIDCVAVASYPGAIRRNSLASGIPVETLGFYRVPETQYVEKNGALLSMSIMLVLSVRGSSESSLRGR
jgi:hypothetical protein